MTIKIDLKKPRKENLQGLKAVSYTHLDVYKRQLLKIITPGL